MTTRPKEYCGCLRVHRHWLLSPHRAAFHVPSATAVVADLHLGYDAARRLGGEAVPMAGFDEIQARLDALLRVHAPERLVIAGDLVENRAGKVQAERLLHWLAKHGVPNCTIVPGNHDRCAWLRQMAGYAESVSIGGWQIAHGDGDLTQSRLIIGHFHPCLRLKRAGSVPCFVFGPRRIIVPAFSNDARGVNILSRELWRTFRCAAIVGDEVLDFGLASNLESKSSQSPRIAIRGLSRRRAPLSPGLERLQ